MIPEILRLRNFLSHRETELDLRGVHLASLVGDNGAGKSALLDAMTWAVWGRSRAPHGRDDQLIYHGESMVEVEFQFRMPYQQAGDYRYRILRRREQRGRRTVKSILDFQVEAPEGWQSLTADTIRQTQQKIIETLKLDYETFINSAYLRQGHADEFTVQSPAQRKQVLSAILGLDIWAVYQERVRTRQSRMQGRLKELDRRLQEMAAELKRRPEFERLLETTEAQAAAAEAQLQLAQLEMDGLHRVREQVAGLERDLEELTRQYEENEAALRRAQEEVERYRADLGRLEALLGRAETVEARYHAYEAAVAEERAYAQKLEQAMTLQRERAAREAEVVRAREALQEQVRTRERETERLRREIEGARVALEQDRATLQSQIGLLKERLPDSQARQALQELEDQVRALDETTRRLERTQAELRQVELSMHGLSERNRQLRERREALAERIEALGAAEAECPLCGQSLSPEHRAEVLGEVEAERSALESEIRSNIQRWEELKGQKRALEAQIKALKEQLEARPERQRQLARLRQRLEEGEQAQGRIAELEGQVEEIAHRLEREAYATEARAALAGVLSDLQALQQRLVSGAYAQEARTALAALADREAALGYDRTVHDTLRARVEELREAESEYRELERAQLSVANEKELLRSRQDQLVMLQERADGFHKRIQEVRARLADLRPRLAQEPAVRQALEDARQRAVALRQQVGAARQNLAALDALEERHKRMQEEYQTLAQEVAVLNELREAFGVNGIPAMLIEHMLPELEREANRVLQKLTAGRLHVRFDTQRETKSGTVQETLDIIISDEKGTRPYEAFSGGEKFRVNFAIRVALSYLLAQRAGVRLRSLFVDEGFGSLDADGRQRLVEAIKAVQNDFDLILVITHIDELRDVFPTQIRVVKTESGSQVEVI